jgi:Ca2+-binding EF-hand superfamily protein
MTAKLNEKDSIRGEKEEEKAFDKFAEGSEYITLEHLQQVSAELGDDMSEEELMLMIKEVTGTESLRIGKEAFRAFLEKATI